MQDAICRVDAGRGVTFSIQKQQLCTDMKRFRSRLVCKAQRLVCHVTLVSRVIKKRGPPGDTPLPGDPRRRVRVARFRVQG